MENWFKKFSANRKWAARIACSRSHADHKVFHRQLSANPTRAEVRVKSYLETLNIDFVFQKRFDGFVADFFFPRQRIVLEIDGSSHDRRKGYDAQRDKWFRYRKLKVIRIRNESTKTLDDFLMVFPQEFKNGDESQW